MAAATEPPLRHQLVAARRRIVAQLDEIECRAAPSGARGAGGPPDYRDVIAELQAELKEIDAILARPHSPDP